jgi:hypothetical protein
MTIKTRRKPLSTRERRTAFHSWRFFAAVASEAAEDSLFSVAMKPDDEVDACGAEPVDVLDLDVLAIEEDGEQVRVDGPGVDELELLDQPGGDGIELVGARTEAHLFEGGFRGVYRTGGTEKAEEQGLHLFGVAPLVGWREGAGSEVSATGSRNLDLDGDGADVECALVAAVAFVARGLGQVVLAFSLPGGGEHHSQELANAEVLETQGEQVVDFLVEDLGERIL